VREAYEVKSIDVPNNTADRHQAAEVSALGQSAVVLMYTCRNCREVFAIWWQISVSTDAVKSPALSSYVPFTNLVGTATPQNYPTMVFWFKCAHLKTVPRTLGCNNTAARWIGIINNVLIPVTIDAIFLCVTITPSSMAGPCSFRPSCRTYQFHPLPTPQLITDQRVFCWFLKRGHHRWEYGSVCVLHQQRTISLFHWADLTEVTQPFQHFHSHPSPVGGYWD